MTGATVRRSGVLLVSAVLLASLAVSATAAPASAAKPKCAGKTATIVGTNKGEVIKGTKKADVIVAKGGHDIVYGRGGNDAICGGGGHDKLVGAAGNDLLFGQFGRDKLFGGAGRDRLLGGPANDRFNGGTGNDACLQGTGTGPRINCERPPVPVTPPPPSGPQLIPLTGILAIAYSDLDGSHSYTVGDVLIAKLVDANGDGVPNVSDTVKLGQYPKDLGASAFGEWGVKSHNVTSVNVNTSQVQVTSNAGSHRWLNGATYQNYVETFPNSAIQDAVSGSGLDTVVLNPASPSQPADTIPATSAGRPSDDPIVDVELNY